MVSSMMGVGFGVISSGLFVFASITEKVSGNPEDVLTIRVGAICSLLVAGGGVVTAIGSQILGAYKLYLQQRDMDTAQAARYEDLARKLEGSLGMSKALEEELVAQRSISENIVKEMSAQLISFRKMVNKKLDDIPKPVSSSDSSTGVADAESRPS